MKKLFPLMFTLVFASQAFAMETEVVVTEEASKSEVVATEVAPVVEATRSVVLDEATRAEAEVVYDELKTRGLTDAQIVAIVEEKLRDETTENVSRSILDQHNKEKIVLLLVGAVAGVLTVEGGKWAYNSYKSAKSAKPAGDKQAEPAK
ncbi:MAG: hypothetical protein WC192_01390 [Candidatus Babeliales bacterium]|jgi:hypothetical protein